MANAPAKGGESMAGKGIERLVPATAGGEMVKWMGSDDNTPSLNVLRLHAPIPQLAPPVVLKTPLIKVTGLEPEGPGRCGKAGAGGWMSIPPENAPEYPLKKAGGGQSIEGMLAMLHDTNPVVRKAGAKALGKIVRGSNARAVPVGKEVVEGLLPLLKDADVAVRRSATEALSKMSEAAVGKEGAMMVESSVAGLRDSDPAVRRGLAEALGKMLGAGGTKKKLPAELCDVAVAGLVGLLRDGDAGVQATAAWALGALGPLAAKDGVLGALAVMLSNADCRVRLEVVEALGKFGPVAAERKGLVEALVALTDDVDAVMRSKAVTTLGLFGPSAVLGREGSVVHRLLGKLEDSNPVVCGDAARALGRLGASVAGKWDIEGKLLKLTSSSHAYVRVEAVWALGTLAASADDEAPREGVIDGLVKALSEDQDRYVKWAAAEALGRVVAAGGAEVSTEDVEDVMNRLVEAMRDLRAVVRGGAASALRRMSRADDSVMRMLQSRSPAVVATVSGYGKHEQAGAALNASDDATKAIVADALAAVAFISEGPQKSPFEKLLALEKRYTEALVAHKGAAAKEDNAPSLLGLAERNEELQRAVYKLLGVTPPTVIITTPAPVSAPVTKVPAPPSVQLKAKGAHAVRPPSAPTTSTTSSAVAAPTSQNSLHQGSKSSSPVNATAGPVGPPVIATAASATSSPIPEPTPSNTVNALYSAASVAFGLVAKSLSSSEGGESSSSPPASPRPTSTSSASLDTSAAPSASAPQSLSPTSGTGAKPASIMAVARRSTGPSTIADDEEDHEEGDDASEVIFALEELPGAARGTSPTPTATFKWQMQNETLPARKTTVVRKFAARKKMPMEDAVREVLGGEYTLVDDLGEGRQLMVRKLKLQVSQELPKCEEHEWTRLAPSEALTNGPRTAAITSGHEVCLKCGKLHWRKQQAEEGEGGAVRFVLKRAVLGAGREGKKA